MKTIPISAFALIILPSIILPFFLLSGCSAPPIAAKESTLAEQLTAVRNGSTDIVLIESTPLRDQDLAPLRDVPGLRVLQLDHIDNGLTDAGMAEISKLTQLEHLRVRGGNIGDNGLKALSTMPNLRILNLPQARFTDAGLAHLKRLPKLQMLRIGSPQVTDAGIAVLKDFPHLRQVHVIDIPLTDRGLADLLLIPKLESLYFDGMKFSDAAVDEMYAKHPDLHVHFDLKHHDRDPHKGGHPHEK